MDASWLLKYPRAAAMLQGDDDVLEYVPQEAMPSVVEIWQPDRAVHVQPDDAPPLEVVRARLLQIHADLLRGRQRPEEYTIRTAPAVYAVLYDWMMQMCLAPPTHLSTHGMRLFGFWLTPTYGVEDFEVVSPDAGNHSLLETLRRQRT